jgi:hypothetical protein
LGSASGLARNRTGVCPAVWSGVLVVVEFIATP